YDQYWSFEFREDCTNECLQSYIQKLELDVIRAQTILDVYKSLKVPEGGTIPKFNFGDVMFYYQEKDDAISNKNIQDLFNINLSNLNFP
ncbi:hypothetical protein DICPUDRAFT_23835, partial [Dictyostelium purpureum]